MYHFYHWLVCLPGSACQSDPCLNGGLCIAIGNIYDCFCPSGFTGANCETGKCLLEQ